MKKIIKKSIALKARFRELGVFETCQVEGYSPYQVKVRCSELKKEEGIVLHYKEHRNKIYITRYE